MDFSSLGLSEALLRAVAEQGYSSPTPIQSQAIPAVLAGRDLLAAAQTGTGKTAAFTLPLLQRLADDTLANDWLGRIPRVLVLVPTRELAAQVSVRIYAGNLPPDLIEKEFAEHGRVRSMNLARDIFSGRCRGFIEMEGHEARAAINALNGHTLRGNCLRVNEERPRGRSGGAGAPLAIGATVPQALTNPGSRA
jgi:hypothetical protein